MRGPDGVVKRSRVIVHTIRNRIVIEHPNLMRDVEVMVREAKKNVPMDVVRAPWK